MPYLHAPLFSNKYFMTYFRVGFIFTIIAVLAACGQEPPADPNNNKDGVNNPPSIAGSPSTQVMTGNTYTFSPAATDPDNDTLLFQIANRPAWANFDSTTGNVSGVPQAAGTYSNIIITVTDGKSIDSLGPFTINVMTPSAGTPTPAIVMVSPNSNLSGANSLSGASLQGTVTIFFQAGSDWSTRGVNRVVFYCCKGGADTHTVFPADTTAPYSISVDLSRYQSGTHELYADAFFNGQTSPDSFTVNFTIANSGNVPPPPPANSAPTITGTPITSVEVSTPYNFTPNANDIDGDNLTFSVNNLPVWAAFNTNTGQITGTPTSMNTYSNITITVTAGLLSASLPPFNIEVTATPVIGNATLSWTPPTYYTDNVTPLTDLAGYNIYYGTTSGSYPNKINLTNPGLTTYVVENLPGGRTYYFSITVLNSIGIESDYSNEVTRKLQ